MTTRRHPRTMEEAFGPGHRGGIYEPTRPIDRADRIVLIGSAIAGACLVLIWIVFGGAA